MARLLPHYGFAGRILSDEECERAIALAQAQPFKQGTVNDAEQVARKQRNSTITFLPQGEDSKWLYDRIAKEALRQNAEFWGFQLDGAEQMQIAQYAPGQHYIAHVDIGMELPYSRRKLSVVIQLTDPSEYEGGDLEIQISGDDIAIAPRGRGEMVLFPSWVLHRVTPVTKGLRWSLANWVIGREPFK